MTSTDGCEKLSTFCSRPLELSYHETPESALCRGHREQRCSLAKVHTDKVVLEVQTQPLCQLTANANAQPPTQGELSSEALT